MATEAIRFLYKKIAILEAENLELKKQLDKEIFMSKQYEYLCIREKLISPNYIPLK